MVLPAPARVPIDVLAWIVRAEGFGELPLVLAPTAAWLPRDTRQAADQRAREKCARLGWLDRRGRLEVEVESVLRVVCRPSVEYFGWIHDGERTTGVLSAAIGREAVLAVREVDSVWLSQIRSVELAERLVAQTPDLPAGPGTPVQVLREEFRATTRDGRRRTETGVGSVPASPPARLARQLVAVPEVGSGELQVAVRDQVGRRRACRAPLHYVDIAHGRYVVAVSVSNGETHVVVTPAARGDLVARLRELHRALPREFDAAGS